MRGGRRGEEEVGAVRAAGVRVSRGRPVAPPPGGKVGCRAPLQRGPLAQEGRGDPSTPGCNQPGTQRPRLGSTPGAPSGTCGHLRWLRAHGCPWPGATRWCGWDRRRGSAPGGSSWLQPIGYSRPAAAPTPCGRLRLGMPPGPPPRPTRVWSAPQTRGGGGHGARGGTRGGRGPPHLHGGVHLLPEPRRGPRILARAQPPLP